MLSICYHINAERHLPVENCITQTQKYRNDLNLTKYLNTGGEMISQFSPIRCERQGRLFRLILFGRNDILSHACSSSKGGGGLRSCVLRHDDVIKWKHFPRYWPFVRGIHWSPVNSPNTGQWRGALMFSLIFACINSWVKNHEAGDLRHHRAHYDVIVMVHLSIEELNLQTIRDKMLSLKCIQSVISLLLF